MMPASLPFPHPELSRIDGKPTNTGIQILQRELYTNARSVVSTRGGGVNGHLSLLMNPAAYLARAGTPFEPPMHPGPAPIHAIGATAGQITETNRQYNATLLEHSLYHQVSVELKRQLLAAVQPAYFRALEDADFGFADITPLMLLEHLKSTYGTLTPQDLEFNRLTLSQPWDPDVPIEDLWCRIKEARRVANTANDNITETTAINLTLTMLETAGVLPDATRAWRLHPLDNWTLDRFTTELTTANRERLRQLTARMGGYHSANAAVRRQSIQPSGPPTAPTENIVSGEIQLYYCWTHGLGRGRTHTSATCANRAPGHITTATASNTQGGNNTFTATRRSSPSANPTRNGRPPSQQTLPTND